MYGTIIPKNSTLILPVLLTVLISSCNIFGSDDDKTVLEPTPDFPEELNWVDMHAHCAPTDDDAGPPDPGEFDLLPLDMFCPDGEWNRVESENGPGAAVILALAAENALSVTDRQDIEGVGALVNDLYKRAAEANDKVEWMASLPCWYDTRFDSDGWVEACKEDVDQKIADGAIGFKDHAGQAKFIANLNWFNEWCDIEGDAEFRQDECLKQITLRYPVLEDKWYQVLKYIVEEKKAAYVSHITSQFNDKEFGNAFCFDPLTSSPNTCTAVTEGHVPVFTQKVEEFIEESARKRIIVAHMAYLPGDTKFEEMLDAGISSDVSTQIGYFQNNPCDARKLLVEHPGQVMFATDVIGLNGDNVEPRSDNWLQILDELTTPGTIADCPVVAPEGLKEKVQKKNFTTLFD